MCVACPSAIWLELVELRGLFENEAKTKGPLVNLRASARVNVQMWKGASRTTESSSVRVAVHARIVPDEAMSHAVLLGCDIRGASETIGKIPPVFSPKVQIMPWAWCEGTGGGSIVVRYAGGGVLWPDPGGGVL